MGADTALFEYRCPVDPAWLDFNGHMNVADYVRAFDNGFIVMMDEIGLCQNGREALGGTIFAAEIHVRYLQEVLPDAELRITAQLLNFTRKKLHYFFSMYHTREGYLASTMEGVSLYVDQSTRRVAEMPDEVFEKIDAIWQRQKGLPVPEGAGRSVQSNRRQSGA